ncbi:MAG: Ppx/GppA family phosphatase [Magnetovibrio sp.]|nr:Ppx/GppA family phosphatase [Magnetovibrio sp.]
MLVARPYGDGFRVVDSFSRIVRLGEGIAAEGRLSEAAIKRTLNALKVCNAKIKSIGAKRVRSIATEACRRAENGPSFLKRVKIEAELDLETISAEEEANLTLAGCSPLLNKDRPNALVFDIGGGSTEVLWIDTSNPLAPKTLDVISLPHGVVTLTESFQGGTGYGESYGEIVTLIDQGLRDFDHRNGIAQAVTNGSVQMLGTSGTVTTLGALHLNLSRYDRSCIDGLDLRFDHIQAIIQHLSTLSSSQRMQNPCIGPKRSDLIMSGCAVLEAICKRWPVGSLVVADRGIREGILLSLMAMDGIHIQRSPHEGSGCHT